MRVLISAFAILLSATGPGAAQDYEIDGVGAYFCDQIGGDPSGDRRCTAPYRAFSGDACSIFDETRSEDPDSADFLDSVTDSCTADAVDEAKAETLERRADLRGYVSAGYDESVNDPVSNPGYRPGDATLYSGSRYFAAECAVQTCGEGGGGGGGGGGETGDDFTSGDDTGAGAQECRFQRDGTCDEPDLCAPGTDREDCSSRYCAYENDGTCDSPGICPLGSDNADCSAVGTAPAAGTLVEFCFGSTRFPQIYVAYGFREKGSDRRIRFRGWRKIAAEDCSVVGRSLDGVVYYYAHTDRINGKRLEWAGSYQACVATKKFDYHQDRPGEACRERSKGFGKTTVSGDKDRVTFRDDGS